MPHFMFRSEALLEGEASLAFNVLRDGRIWPAFVIRHEGKLRAYLNVCAHAALPIDAGRGDFFSRDRQSLVCTAHGAVYAPDSGRCTSGPCRGLSLIPLRVTEIKGSVYYDDHEYEYCV